MRRVVVLGASGFFGRAVVAALRERDCVPVALARTDLDAEDAGALHGALHPGDVVVDAAGPFHVRTTRSLEIAMDIGCDVVDLSDDLGYARAVLGFEDSIARAGISVFSSCSSVSTVTSTLVAMTGIANPARVSVCLRPAARETATRGTARVLLRHAGGAVESLRRGALTAERGWSRKRAFLSPAGRLHGHLAESADALCLPRVYPTLRDVDFWVDTGIPGVNMALGLTGPLARERELPLGVWLARRFGRHDGAIAVEVEGNDAALRTAVAYAPTSSHLIAVIPAVLAVLQLAAVSPARAGLVPHDRQVPPDQLLTALHGAGVRTGLA